MTLGYFLALLFKHDTGNIFVAFQRGRNTGKVYKSGQKEDVYFIELP